MKLKQGKRRILWIESIGFSIIIVLAWLTEVIRLPHVLFDEPFVPNWHRAILRTVIVVLIWIWVFVETRRLLDRLRRLEEFLVVCAWCRKIGDRGEWVSMETYFGSNFDTRTSHAMCPECSDKFIATMPHKKGMTDPDCRELLVHIA